MYVLFEGEIDPFPVKPPICKLLQKTTCNNDCANQVRLCINVQHNYIIKCSWLSISKMMTKSMVLIRDVK